MTDALTMERTSRAEGAQDDALIDCDIHPALRSPEQLRPYLSRRWWEHLTTFGRRPRHGFAQGVPYPKLVPDAARRDAYPATGPAGGDLDFMREQHLDPLNVRLGVLNLLNPNGGDQNQAFSAAICAATNDWLRDEWTRREPRLKAAISVAYEDGELARAEIERRASDPDFVQILLLSRTSEPLGKRRYWPIYRAAVESGLPVAIHVFGYSGFPPTNVGWPSYYLEEGAAQPASLQASIASLIFEGVFETFPELKIIVIEAGFAWLPPLGWRLDRLWRRLRDEVPHVTRPPSERIRERIWISTQPMEESPHPGEVAAVMEEIGWDRLMYASDYPHWDFDDPRFGLPPSLNRRQRSAIRFENANALYRR